VLLTPRPCHMTHIGCSRVQYFLEPYSVGCPALLNSFTASSRWLATFMYYSLNPVFVDFTGRSLLRITRTPETDFGPERQPHDAASSHVRVRKAPVPTSAADSGIPNPPSGHLTIWPTTRAGTAHTSRGLLENQHAPSESAPSNIAVIHSRCASAIQYAR